MDSPWLPYVYDYSVGGLIFAATLILGLKVGAIDMRRESDRRTLIMVVAGFFLFAATHAVWIILASASSGPK